MSHILTFKQWNNNYKRFKILYKVTYVPTHRYSYIFEPDKYKQNSEVKFPDLLTVYYKINKGYYRGISIMAPVFDLSVCN
jgi:hypothetical protein